MSSSEDVAQVPDDISTVSGLDDPMFVLPDEPVTWCIPCGHEIPTHEEEEHREEHRMGSLKKERTSPVI